MLEKENYSKDAHVFIGDIHGRDSWKKIVERENEAGVYVFFGDYFDAKDLISGPKQLENFYEIVDFKQRLASAGGKQKAIMLFGNHDYHYMPWFTRQPYSGYLPYMAAKYKRALVQHLGEMQIAYAMGDVLCSHAGVSYEWLTYFLGHSHGGKVWLEMTPDEIAIAVNAAFLENPRYFDFNGFNPFGDDPYQSPIWVRPPALKKANAESFEKQLIQVYGHTVVKNVQESFSKNLDDDKGRYFAVDLLGQGPYAVVLEGGNWRLSGGI